MNAKLTQRARKAIVAGIERNDSVAELAKLGVAIRTIAALEKHLGIIYLEDLVCVTSEQVCEVPNIGAKAQDSIMDALCRYHEIDSYFILQHEAMIARKARRWRTYRVNPPN